MEEIVEIWIALLLAVAGLSGWAGYFWASRRAPKREELDALAAELDEARRRADSVQANVDEHFEQSARLFGKLAGDYREFLEHFAGSAQALGLSESRTRELVQQSFQPLLTHEVDDLVVSPETDSTSEAEATAVEESVANETLSEEGTESAPEEAPEEEKAQPVRVAEVSLNDSGTAPESDAGEGVPTVENRVEAESEEAPASPEPASSEKEGQEVKRTG